MGNYGVWPDFWLVRTAFMFPLGRRPVELLYAGDPLPAQCAMQSSTQDGIYEVFTRNTSMQIYKIKPRPIVSM